MDFGLVEYALFVIVGLWATLFVANPIARAAGALLVILAVLRALTEAERPERQAAGDDGEGSGTP